VNVERVLLESANQFGGFVCGDAAGDAEGNFEWKRLGMVGSYEVIVIRRVFAQVGGNGDERAAGGVSQRQQSAGVNHGSVFHYDRWLGCEYSPHGCGERVGAAFAAGVEIGGSVECAAQDGGAAALLGREVTVAELRARRGARALSGRRQSPRKN